MLDQKDLIELNVGDDVRHFLILSKLQSRITKNGKPYLDLEFKDTSETIQAKMWEGFGDFEQRAEVGNVVKVLGKIEDFSGNRQLKVDKIRISSKEDNVNVQDLMPKSRRDLDEMLDELQKRISQIANVKLKELLDKILSGEKFEKYKLVPAGKSWHHAYVHGLLEHTLEIIKICDLMSDIHPDVNRDLLITAAVIHDFGKTEELTSDAVFEYTDKGKLIGHIVIAAIEIEKAASRIENFPEDLKNQLIHLVLSHQGKLEHASPVEPKTTEAIILYHADELSAKTNAYKTAIDSEKRGNSKWTRYLPLAGTDLYVPNDENDVFNETLFD